MLPGIRPIGNARQLEARRQRAVALLRAGRSYREVAETLNASVSSIVRWQQAYRQGGKVALRSKPTPGRPSRLGPVQRAELEALLSAGAQKVGYSTDQWTLRRVAELIEKRCRIRYGRTGVRKVLMQKLRWSWQKPERRALQREAAAIAAWKRTTWPAIKKSP